MKSFSQLVQEANAPRARVVLFGRMNPPTSGHEENVLAAHKLAQKNNAELHVVASHSHDPKKNPLSPVQKVKHLNRAFGHLENTSIGTSSKEAPSVLDQAVAAHKSGVKHFIMAGGGDRAAGYHKLLKQYNGVTGKPHGYYKFDKITVANTGARKEGISGTELRRHVAAGNYDKFKQQLPSKIQGNEKHSQELYKNVQAGLTRKEEFTREDYVQGLGLQLGTEVEDTQTGLTGRIVYRGPTYVTVQINEELSFKRWINDVDSLAEDDLPDTPVFTFKNYVAESYPADVKKQLLDSLHLCPGAQKEFDRLLDDSNMDQGVVLEALDATAHYLNIEELGAKDPTRLDDHAITQFVEHMRHAASMLRALGDLPAHEQYMEAHAHTLMNLIHGKDPGPKEENVDMDGFKNFINEKMDAAQKQSIDMDPHLDEKDLADIEKHIDQLEWEDVRHILGQGKQTENQAADATDEEVDLDGNVIDEALTAADRMKKRMQFTKTKAKRQIARKIALKRLSTFGKLKKKAVVHARTLIMKKILKGRDKSKLSAAEKDRIEAIVHRAKAAVVRISNKLLPKLRDLEKQRLKRMHEDWAETGDIEKTAYDTVSKHDTDVSNNPKLDHVKAHLAGHPYKDQGNFKPDAANHVRRMKNFRKMEV